MRLAFASTTIAAAFAAAGLSACASLDYHYSQISGQRYFHKADIDTYSVSILRIDGRDTILHPTPVDPGMRKIVVQGPPDGVSRQGRQREISLEVKPCTRYYLVAVKANKLASDFDVRVDYQEPVGGCTPPTAAS